jgi:hypothetical protein
VFPSHYKTAWGEIANAFPFQRAPMRYQQVFLASENPNPIVFTGVAMREDETYAATAGIWNGSITLGFTTMDHSNIGTDFVANYNASPPPTQVFSGNVNLPALAGNNTNLNVFAVPIVFNIPWVYAAVPGNNLLIEFVVNSTTSTGFYDKVNNTPGTGTTTRVYAFATNVQFATATFRNDGLIMCFLTTPQCPPAQFATYGSGCPGAAPPALGNQGLPQLGQNFSLLAKGARANSLAMLFTGFSNSNWSGLPLPFDLTGLGAPGCSLLAPGSVIQVTNTDAVGSASQSLGVPNDQSLCGAHAYHQWVILDVNANMLGFAFSNGGDSRLGT